MMSVLAQGLHARGFAIERCRLSAPCLGIAWGCIAGSAVCLLSEYMAPHLSAKELDFITTCVARGKTLGEVHAAIAKQRARRDMAAPSITNIRKAMRGRIYLCCRVERRGRKRKLNAHAAQKANRVCKGEKELHWKGNYPAGRKFNKAMTEKRRQGVAASGFSTIVSGLMVSKWEGAGRATAMPKAFPSAGALRVDLDFTGRMPALIGLVAPER